MKKNALAIILALCMVIAMLPATVFAAPNGEQLTKLMVPNTIGKLEPAAITPNAKSYKVSLTGEGNGEVELLVDSPAKEGSEVYFIANPDDGYLAEVYYTGLDDDALLYLGADMWGFIMPANKVTLEVKFVAAEGEEHRIDVVEYGGGDCALSRDRAKQYESVLLAVLPNNASDFDPETHVQANGGVLFYLYEDDEGIHYYELIVDDEDVKIAVAYKRTGPNRIGMLWTPEEATVTIDPEKAYFLDTVTVTIKPYPGYHLVRAVASSHAGDFNSELTPIGNDQYTFIMHPGSVELYLTFESDPHSITINAGPGGTAYTDVAMAPSGRVITLTCVPDEGYEVDRVTGAKNIIKKNTNLYTFTMSPEDVIVNVTFKGLVNPIQVTVDTGLGGTAYTEVTEAATGDPVKLVCVPDEGYRVAQITGVNAVDNGDDTYTFTMPAKAADVHVLFLRHENPFVDINETQFFYDPVLWAVGEGITNGIDATHFGPMMTTNRAAVVTMLWRYAGSPEPTTTENPFEDVPADIWYTKPVLWAVENGITNGISATEFGPNGVCNRAQVVTFLYRALKASVPAGTENPFVDVSAGQWYEVPVLWALANGVTNGADATHFNPNGECLRAQFVTFLYRASLIPPAPAQYELHWVINGLQDTPSDYGTVTLSHETAAAGETVTATVIPAEGYVIDWVKCENGSEITKVSDTEYTFVMPEGPEIFHVNFVAAPTEPEEPEPTDPTDPTEPVKTYTLDVHTNVNAEITYVDGKTAAAPGESIFFYVKPEAGYVLSGVSIFDPYGEIDLSRIQLYAHEDDLYEFVMIDHDIILNINFAPA